jgi:hypothetical protein
MKMNAGLCEEQEHSDGSDYESEQVFKKLKPGSTHKLMDILKGKVNMQKQKLYKIN